MRIHVLLSCAFAALSLAASTARATDHVVFTVAPGSEEWSGFGEIPPGENDLRVTLAVEPGQGEFYMASF